MTRKRKASPSTPAAHGNETESAAEREGEKKAEGLPASAWTEQDIANVAVLRALCFTKPVTLDDCREAYKYAHSMRWSSRPRVDFVMRDEATVEMRVQIGTDGVGAVFRAE